MDQDLPEITVSSNNDDTYDVVDYTRHTRKRISGMELRDLHLRLDWQTKKEMERLKMYIETPELFDFDELKKKVLSKVLSVVRKIKESGWTIKW